MDKKYSDKINGVGTEKYIGSWGEIISSLPEEERAEVLAKTDSFLKGYIEINRIVKNTQATPGNGRVDGAAGWKDVCEYAQHRCNDALNPQIFWDDCVNGKGIACLEGECERHKIKGGGKNGN